MNGYKRLITAAILWFFIGAIGVAQGNNAYWQQKVDYTMDVFMDVNTYQYSGSQTLVYTNNSPEELSRVFYHMYFNAFQPGSEMDIRLQNVVDPDKRMFVDGKSRIAALAPEEIGYLKAISLQQDGVPIDYTLRNGFGGDANNPNCPGNVHNIGDGF